MAPKTSPQLTFEVSTQGREPYTVTLRKAKNIVGRESGDIVLNDVEASALHAEIDSSAGHVIVRDLGSSNGTWRNGERLPQFALYEGQSFFCGNTEVTLRQIQGDSARLRPGQTAVGIDRVDENAQTHTNADRVEDAPLPPPPTSTTQTWVGRPNKGPVAPPPGWSPPSPLSLGKPAPVSPGAQPSSSTLPGPAGTTPQSASAPPSSATVPEPPSAAPPSSSATVPATGTESAPSSATVPELAAATPTPATLKDVSSPAAATVADGPSPSVESQPTPEPTSEAKPASNSKVFRPAVANAVIKDGGAKPPKASEKRSESTSKGQGVRWGRTLGIGAIAAIVAAGLAGVVYLVWGMFQNRDIEFAREVANDLPETTVGFFAGASLDEALTLLGDDVPEPMHEQASNALGFDPLTVDGWRELGIDTTRHVGIGLLDVDPPVFAASVGVQDDSALRKALEETLPRFVASQDEPLEWTSRTFGDVESLWIDDPPMAVLMQGDRSILVWSPASADAAIISKHAQSVADTTTKTSLAASDGIEGLISPPGKTLAVVYGDGRAIRNSLTDGGLSTMAARMALADIDGLAWMVSHEGSDVHSTYETVLREGSRHLELFEGHDRESEAIQRLEGPVLGLAATHVNPEALDRAMGGVATAFGGSISVFEQQVLTEAGIDLRDDVTSNVSGDVGIALLKLPPAPDESDEANKDPEVVAWLGVLDEEKAAQAVARLCEKYEDPNGHNLTPKQVGDVQVFTREKPQESNDAQIQVFVTAKHVWVAVGDVDVQSIIDGPEESFLEGARHDAIRAAMQGKANAHAFVDLRSTFEQMVPLLSKREREEYTTAEPILDLFEVLSLKGEVHGRTATLRTTLHTSAEQGLPEILGKGIEVAGSQFATSLARASRRKRCAAVATHVAELSRAELEKSKAEIELAWEIERQMLEECDRPTTTEAHIDCVLDATTVQGMRACDAKHPPNKEPVEVVEKPTPASDSGSTPTKPQGEPKAVPYVEDIWPHLGDDPDSEHPQPEVNYAVPVGEDPYARGPEDALVTVIMFGDFECPHCRAVTGTLDEVLAEHGDSVRLVFRNMPLEKIHPNAKHAARTALAAGEQDKFWEIHDELFALGNRLSEDAIDNIAKDLGLDMTKLAAARTGIDVTRRMQRDEEAATKFGVRGTPAFFVNGRYLGGRQSKSAFNAVIAEEKARAERFVERRGDTRKNLYADMISHFAPEVLQPSAQVELPDDDAKRYTISTSGLPRKGASSFAQVQIIECGDFDCPYCARSRKALDDVLDDYTTQVALYFAHSPLDFHVGAEPAARAAAAAHAQDKFWEMHDELFDNQSGKERTEADYARYAGRIGLNVKKFKEEFASAKTAKIVEDQRKLCADNDATATPTFFVNGRRVTGAQTVEQFKALIEAELSKGI